MKAMTFREIKQSELDALIDDDRYAFEQKVDGSRAVLVIEDNLVTVLGRHGGQLKHTAATQHLGPIRAAVTGLWPYAVLDGEVMIDSGKFVLFDMPEAAGIVSPTDPLSHRLDMMVTLCGVLPLPIVRVAHARTPDAKRRLVSQVKAQGGEGIMVKRLDSPYEPGSRVKHSVKVKFTKTADVVVLKCTRSRNEAGREVGSFHFGVYNEAGEMVKIGQCSAIGKPHAEPGEVIEVKYLSWGGGALVQPTMLKVRPDKEPTDCRLDQIPAYSKGLVQ